MLGKRQYMDATCNVRMNTGLPLRSQKLVYEVHNLQTAPGMRGKGQGTKLMQQICADADRLGKILMLVSDNTQLEKWYNKFGFERVQEKPILMFRHPKS